MGGQRSILYGVALVCVIIAGWAGMRASTLLVEARSQALFDAERAIAQTTAPLIEQRRIPNRLVLAVQSLLGDQTLDLNYITLRNADNVILVSRGRMQEAFAWLPTGPARRWRGWLYRLGSAEVNRPVMRAEERVGYAHYGVAWTHIMGQAGADFLIWILAVAAAVLGFGASLMRATTRAAAPAPPRAGAAAGIASPPASSSPTDQARAPLSRLARRSRQAPDDDFAPIAASPLLERPTHDIASDANAVAPPADAAPAQSAGRERSAPATPIAPAKPGAPPDSSNKAKSKPAVSKRQAVPRTPMDDSDTPMPVPEQFRRKPESGRTHPARAHGITSLPADGGVFHAPKVDVEPQLGDSTLDLRFYPIWQGHGAERVLVAAFATLAWRTGEAEVVDAATLTRLAEREGALRAFTQWIARRFSLLHGNWRTLELATVPILLPVPSALLAFADAEAVWRDALRRTDRDPDDLILRLTEHRQEQPHIALPVRRAFALEQPEQQITPDCDLLCIAADRINGSREAWQSRVAELQRPVLLGPVSDPADWTDFIAQTGVCWYRETPEDLHSPRSFGRLLARQTVHSL